MKKIAIILSLIGFGFIHSHAAEPDILVTQAGERLKVYNLELSSNSVFYTLTDAADASVEKLGKSAVLIIKKADGSVLNLNEDSQVTPVQGVKNNKVNSTYEAVTYNAMNDFVQDKKGKKFIKVEGNKGQILYMRILSDADRTLTVTKCQEKGHYDCSEYIIPEYVIIGEKPYTVIAIDEDAFKAVAANTGAGFGALIARAGGADNIKSITFPTTLKSIGRRAFSNNSGLERVILPEGLEFVGEEAFTFSGVACKTFQQLYIPNTVKEIGSNAFKNLGPNTSPKGYFQGNLTCIPDFITTGNCTSIGIDEEAVEAYEKRKR